MTLHLIQIQPDAAALARFVRRAGLPTDDLGYCWHCALRDAFGQIAPQPFRAFDPDPGDRQDRPAKPTRLLGYASADAAGLCEALALAAPDLDAVFPTEGILSKRMPKSFAAGRRLAFEIRICPIVRTQSSDGTRQRELDAFVHHASAIADQPKPQREPIYRDWLAARLAEAGANLVETRMAAFRLAPLVRRRHASPTGRTPTEDGAAKRLLAQGRRAARRPEVVFTGQLEITDATAFAGGLARGIGRHRAFGFGMLLLRPS